MGFSRGGQTTLYASLKRFHQAWDPEVAFAAYIPLYASCNPTLIGDTDVAGVPDRRLRLVPSARQASRPLADPAAPAHVVCRCRLQRVCGGVVVDSY